MNGNKLITETKAFLNEAQKLKRSLVLPEEVERRTELSLPTNIAMQQSTWCGTDLGSISKLFRDAMTPEKAPEREMER